LGEVLEGLFFNKIRPAYFNGVFGHKASSLLISNEGQFPLASGEASKYLITGPLCRKSEDLWPLIKIMSNDRVNGDPSQVEIKNLRVISLDGLGIPFQNVETYLLDKQKEVVDHLKDLGATIRTDITKIENLEEAVGIWSSMLQTGNPHSHYDNLGQPNVFIELIKLLLRGREGPPEGTAFTLPSLILCYLEVFF
jgi:fatty acid amide hydrolase 2